MPSSRSGHRLAIQGSRLGLKRVGFSSAEMPIEIDEGRLGPPCAAPAPDQLPGLPYDRLHLVFARALPLELARLPCEAAGEERHHHEVGGAAGVADELRLLRRGGAGVVLAGA